MLVADIDARDEHDSRVVFDPFRAGGGHIVG
jgi:hypothetical protein